MTERVESLSALTQWTFDPVVIAVLALVAGLYARGWRVLGRRARGRARLPSWRAWAFAGGMAALGLAMLSPLDTFDSELFAVHMSQHLVLMLVAAPLLLLGAPVLPLLWGLPVQERRGLSRLFLAPRSPVHRLGHLLTTPVVAACAYVLTVAVWHVPPLYDAAQGPTLMHDLEHALFFGTALLYWWPIIHPTGGVRRLSYGLAIFYLLPALMEGAALGALLTFASQPLYVTYQLAPRVSSLSALDDQRLGGLIMWIPSGFAYLLAILCLFGLALREEEQQEQREAAQLSAQAIVDSSAWVG